MRYSLFLISVLLLTGCSAPPPTNSPSPLPASALSLTSTFTSTPFLPAPNLSQMVTPVRIEFTATPAPEIPTETAIATTISYPHVFPVQPPEAAGFAEGTSSHGYPATDIFASIGIKFVAVTDGVVDFVSSKDLWDPVSDDPSQRGGLSVAIIGDDGLRYYGSHLSAIATGIAPGIRVIAGQELGLIGNTGDARNTLPHLHFGISRPTTPDDWKARRGQIDPFPFLQAWRDGHNVTPPLPEISSTTQTPTPSLYEHIFPLDPASLAEFSSGGHPYPATDIFAPIGTKYVAVASGVVDEVFTVDLWNPITNDNATAGGLSVRIIGDDGLRYYGAHLSAIAEGIRPGVWVPAGKLLGLVGNSGNAINSMPHLHFEISIPNPPFTKIDPYPYLLTWREGKNITPSLPGQ